MTEERDLSDFDLQRRLEHIEPALADIQNRVVQLEKSNAIADVHRLNVEKRLTAIEIALNRLVWLMISVLVAGIGTFVLQGGLNIGP